MQGFSPEALLSTFIGAYLEKCVILRFNEYTSTGTFTVLSTGRRIYSLETVNKKGANARIGGSTRTTAHAHSRGSGLQPESWTGLRSSQRFQVHSGDATDDEGSVQHHWFGFAVGRQGIWLFERDARQLLSGARPNAVGPIAPEDSGACPFAQQSTARQASMPAAGRSTAETSFDARYGPRAET